MTIIKHYTEKNAIANAANIIKCGGTVVFPTETVYGLGADGLNSEAVAKIFKAKGRPTDNPMILHISNLKMLDDIVAEIPDQAQKLIEKFWPGPLTLIFNKNKNVPTITTGGLDTVAVRLPSHLFAQMLISASGLPLAAPSANRSGSPSPTKASHAINDLDGCVDMIVIGEDCDIGLESTVVSVCGDVPMLLRPGAITYEALLSVCGKVDIAPSITAHQAVDKPLSPGMKYTHYSPKAEVFIFPLDKPTSDLDSQIKNFEMHQKKVIVIDDNANNLAKNFYAQLRDADDKSYDIIIVKEVESSGIGLAVMNRALKSAGYKIL